MTTSRLVAKISIKPLAKMFIPLWIVQSRLGFTPWVPDCLFRIEVVPQ